MVRRVERLKKREKKSGEPRTAVHVRITKQKLVEEVLSFDRTRPVEGAASPVPFVERLQQEGGSKRLQAQHGMRVFSRLLLRQLYRGSQRQKPILF